jgi:hypothetical protein
VPATRAPEPAPAPQAAAAPTPQTAAASARRNATELRAEFGTPDFVRRETDSELWRYDGEGCSLFAVLYRDNADFLVRHIETLPQGNGMPADEACVNRIKASAAAPPS